MKVPGIDAELAQGSEATRRRGVGGAVEVELTRLSRRDSEVDNARVDPQTPPADPLWAWDNDSSPPRGPRAVVELELARLGPRGPGVGAAAAAQASGLLEAPPASEMQSGPPAEAPAGPIHGTDPRTVLGTKLYGELRFEETGPGPCCCVGLPCWPDYVRKRAFVKVYDTHLHSNVPCSPCCCCCCCPGFAGESDVCDSFCCPLGGAPVIFHDKWFRGWVLCCGAPHIYVKKRYCRGDDIMLSGTCCLSICCVCLDPVCPCDLCSSPLFHNVSNGAEFLTQWRAARDDYREKFGGLFGNRNANAMAFPQFRGLPPEASQEAPATNGGEKPRRDAEASLLGQGASKFVQMEDRFEAAAEYEDFAPVWECNSCEAYEDTRRRWSFKLYDSHYVHTFPQWYSCCCCCFEVTPTATRGNFYDRLAPGGQPGCRGRCARILGPPVIFVERPTLFGEDLRPFLGESIKVAPCACGGCRPCGSYGKPIWAYVAIKLAGGQGLRNGEDFLRSWQKVLNAYFDKHGVHAEHRTQVELQALNARLELLYLKNRVMERVKHVLRFWLPL